MYGSALRCVRSDELSLYNNTKWLKIEKPAGIYHYVAESSCGAKPILGGQIEEVLVFFSLTQTNKQTNKQTNSFVLPTGHKYRPN